MTQPPPPLDTIVDEPSPLRRNRDYVVLTTGQIKDIIIAGFKSAFMPYREKADLLAEIVRELATFTAPTNGKAVVADKTADKPAAPGAPGDATRPRA